MAFLTRSLDASAERAEAFVHVLLSRHQLALAVLDVGTGAVAVVLQFKQPVGLIERRTEARGIDGMDTREPLHFQHLNAAPVGKIGA
jgi:hypothetical protein